MNNIDHIFQDLDNLIDQHIGTNNPEAALTSFYFDFWNQLKLKVGTSSGFTGLSEYLFFQYILRYLEKSLNIEFEPHQETSETYSFRSENIMMTHDIDISRFIDVKGQKTDIAVFTMKDNTFQLIAAFQLKIYITSPSALKDDLSKLDELGEKTSAVLYEITLNPPTEQGKEHLRQFCGKYEGRAYAISKFDMGCNIGLNEAMERIIKNINTSTSTGG